MITVQKNTFLHVEIPGAVSTEGDTFHVKTRRTPASYAEKNVVQSEIKTKQ